jgi:hypothetical protein
LDAPLKLQQLDLEVDRIGQIRMVLPETAKLGNVAGLGPGRRTLVRRRHEGILAATDEQSGEPDEPPDSSVTRRSEILKTFSTSP